METDERSQRAGRLQELTKTVHFEGPLNPNAMGKEEKRVVSSVTADELKWTNPASNTGGKTESVYKRAK